MRIRYLIILFILIGLSFNLKAQRLTVNNSDIFYQIAPVYDFKQGIVSLTFDDASINQFLVALPLLEEKGIPATFYVITDLVDSTIKSIILNNLSEDYEIGSHTVTHANLIKIGSEDAKMELLNSRSFLRINFGANAGLTMSYPWGEYNSSVEQITKSMYLAARTTDVGFNSLSPLDKYELRVMNFDKRISAHEANPWVNFAIQNRLWLVEMIHGINGVGYSPIDSIVLAEHLDYIASNRSSIWCTTVISVIKYIDEAEKAEIKCETCNDTVFKIRINDYLEDSVYNQPLSVRIKIPDSWDSIAISGMVNFSIEYKYKSKFILFNAIPDNKVITIRPKTISIPERESEIRLIYFGANPFHDFIKMSVEALDQMDINIVLCDINGKLLINQKQKNVIGVLNLLFDTSGLSKGVYFLRVSSEKGDLIIKKLIKN
jgi:Polysaccharide deacetylase/Secretion system C-terminal sorting domain